MLSLMSEVTSIDSLSFKSPVSESSPCLPGGKIKAHGEEVSGSLLLGDSDEERGYFSDCDSVWDTFYAELALTDYNKIHHTDYKLEVADEFTGGDHIFKPNLDSDWSVVHVQFAAKSIKASDGHSSPKLFFAELLRSTESNEHIVTSCHVLEGPTTGCHFCDRAHLVTSARSQTFGQKRKYNIPRFPKAALALYNLHHNKDYEMVGDPDIYYSIDEEFVAHCNFRAKRKTACDCEASLPELFFAEQQQVFGPKWIVTACCILDGCKTTAGCYLCIGRRGKRIQHPVGGFCNGMTPSRPHST